MRFHVLRNRLPHQRDQRAIAKILTGAGASELQKFSIELFDIGKVEFVLGVKADVFPGVGSQEQAISPDYIAAAEIADNDVIAARIELIDVEIVFIGGLKAFVKLKVKNLKPEFLRFSDFTFILGDLNFEPLHFKKANIRIAFAQTI